VRGDEHRPWNPRLALLANRALWLHYTGGNRREWSLWTATTTRRTPKLLQAATRDVDDPAPIVIDSGDGSRFGDLLPYAVGSQVFVLRANGARRFAWTAPARVVALASADGETAVATDEGDVTILDASGRPDRTASFPAGIESLQLAGSRVLAQRGRTLEQRGGDGPRSFRLPRGARVEDTWGDRAFYVAGGVVRELSLSTGAERTIARATHVQAALSMLYLSADRRITARRLR
jgi:hypothetical protein